MRVPPGTASRTNSTREPGASGTASSPSGAGSHHQNARRSPGHDLLDDAAAPLAAGEREGRRAAFAQLQLDALGEPVLELLGLGQAGPGLVRFEGEGDVSRNHGVACYRGAHEQPNSCTSCAHGRPPGPARRAVLRHLQPPARRADRLRRLAHRRRGGEPRRRPAPAPRGRRPRPRHLHVHQLAGRPGLLRPGDLRHDAVHRARRADGLLRRRDEHRRAVPGRRRAGQALDAGQRPHADPPALGRASRASRPTSTSTPARRSPCAAGWTSSSPSTPASRSSGCTTTWSATATSRRPRRWSTASWTG